MHGYEIWAGPDLGRKLVPGTQLFSRQYPAGLFLCCTSSAPAHSPPTLSPGENNTEERNSLMVFRFLCKDNRARQEYIYAHSILF